MSVLADVLAPGLRVVFCGTAAGTRSAAVGHYYAGKGNRFWSTLAETGLTPRILSPAEYPQLLQFGIGLTDIEKDQAGEDWRIRFGPTSADMLRRKILEFAPRLLCFNGKRAAAEYFGRRRAVSYGAQKETIGSTKLFVAPSTSGAARRYWDPAVWSEMAALADTIMLAPGST